MLEVKNTRGVTRLDLRNGVIKGKITQPRLITTNYHCRLITADYLLPTADRRLILLLDNIVTLFIFYLNIVLDSQSRMCDSKQYI